MRTGMRKLFTDGGRQSGKLWEGIRKKHRMSFGGNLVRPVIVLFLSVIMLALWINRLCCLQYRSIKEQWDYSHQVRVGGILHFSIESRELQTHGGASENKVDEIERRELRKENGNHFESEIKLLLSWAVLPEPRDFWFSKVMLDEFNGTFQYHIPHETVAGCTALLDFKFF